MFLNATVCPTVAVAGFGENAPLPELPTMLTVTLAPDDAGVEEDDEGVVGAA